MPLLLRLARASPVAIDAGRKWRSRTNRGRGGVGGRGTRKGDRVGEGGERYSAAAGVDAILGTDCHPRLLLHPLPFVGRGSAAEGQPRGLLPPVSRSYYYVGPFSNPRASATPGPGINGWGGGRVKRQATDFEPQDDWRAVMPRLEGRGNRRELDAIASDRAQGTSRVASRENETLGSWRPCPTEDRLLRVLFRSPPPKPPGSSMPIRARSRRRGPSVAEPSFPV